MTAKTINLLSALMTFVLFVSCATTTTETVHLLVVTNHSDYTVDVRAESPDYREAFERALEPANTVQFPRSATVTLRSMGGDQPLITDIDVLLEGIDTLQIAARIGGDAIEMRPDLMDSIQGNVEFTTDDNFEGWLTMTKYYRYSLDLTDASFEP